MANLEREVVGKGNDKGRTIMFGGSDTIETYITSPASPEAQQWKGWKTALKPATEHWLLCRKPLSEPTVAQNVLKHGTGGLNVKECAVGIEEIKTNAKLKGSSFTSLGNGQGFNGCNESLHTGRFPSNLILDGSECVVREFPEVGNSAERKCTGHKNNDNWSTDFFGDNYHPGFSDSGSAARFFYQAKPSPSERSAGLDGFEPSKMDLSRKEGNPGGDNPRNRGVNLKTNNHPTVKSIALMEYLIKLITPPNGIVLDCFMGSGSTGCAAAKNGFQFVGIEQNPEYVKIAEARIKFWENYTEPK